MSLSSEVVLRPRFKIDLEQSNESALDAFAHAASTQKKFVVTRVDDHVFIRLPKEKQHFWSPQLDLEILEIDKESSRLHGLFGPRPAVWTMFMFIHFVVGTLFTGAGVWAYSNASLDQPYALQLALMGLLVIIWFALYFLGRMGRATGRDEMRDLHFFMKDTLKL